MYKLPIGIRIPNKDEYPKGAEPELINNRRNSANIVSGFIIMEILGQRYTHFAEVNVNADILWNVFCELTSKLFDDLAYGIIGFKGEKPTLSNFTGLEVLMAIFEQYKFELTNDGYLEFGIAHCNENTLNEIFISSFKFMRIWTNKKELLIDTLSQFGITQIDNLQFIDEFPIVSEALRGKGIRHYSEVISCIEKEFKKL